MRKKKVIPLLLLIVILVSVGFYIRSSSLRRAEYLGDTLHFDDKEYVGTSYMEIQPYNETGKVICKTTDGAWTIYEIEEYPEHEYIVARAAWEARVLKLKE